MAKYLTNKETQARLEHIIRNAEKKLVLVSPYIELTNTWLARIREAAEKGVLVEFVYRINKVKQDELDRLNTIKNVKLKFTDDLHAKCYFNENDMIITSWNLLATSEKNWEMGIYVNRNDDKEIFKEAMEDVQTIFSDSISLSNYKIKEKVTDNKTSSKDAYCIRCENKIPFDISKPLCRDCYTSWSEWGVREHPENFCHFSGEASHKETCFARPVLNKNWKKAKAKYGLSDFVR